MLLGIGLEDSFDCSLPEFHELLMRHPIENIEFVVPKHLEGCGGMVLLKDLRASELEGCTGGYTLLSLYFSARSDCELTSKPFVFPVWLISCINDENINARLSKSSKCVGMRFVCLITK